MKRILIVIVSFLLIAGMCLYCRALVASVKTDICACLEEIGAGAQIEDKAACVTAVNTLVDKANEAGRKLGRFYPHVYGEKLKEYCRKIKYCIEEENWVSLDENIAECRYVLQTIVWQEEIKWENIF